MKARSTAVMNARTADYGQKELVLYLLLEILNAVLRELSRVEWREYSTFARACFGRK